MKPFVVLSLTPLPFHQTPSPLDTAKVWGLSKGICGNCYRGSCVVPSALLAFSLRSWVPTGSGILGAQGYPWKGCHPPALLESPQVSPVCRTDRSVCVCACARAQICAWDCAFKGPGGRGSRTSPSLPALSLPKCLGSLSKSRARTLWPVSWVPGGREERLGHWHSAQEDWTLRTPARVVLVLGPLEALTYRNSLCFPFLPLLTNSC